MMTKNITKKDMAIRHGITQQDVIARFNSKLVAKDNGCIELNTFAYDPRDRYRGFTIMYPNQNKEYVQATVKAHRFAYALHYGFDALPESDNFNAESSCINHICGNTRCVNPEHLNVMTVVENSIYRAPKDNMITMSMVNAKTCSKCNTNKRLDDFYNRTSMPDMKDYYCKACRNDYTTKNVYRGSNYCSVDGCKNFHYAKTMCKNHYHRYLYNNKKGAE